MKQTFTKLKREIDIFKSFFGNFKTILSSGQNKQNKRINKYIEILRYTIKILDLINIYRTLHHKLAEFTFFPRAY